MLQTTFGSAFAQNVLVPHCSNHGFRSAAVKRLPIARNLCIHARSKDNVNGKVNQGEQDGPAQPEERFVSVSDLLAEVRASS